MREPRHCASSQPDGFADPPDLHDRAVRLTIVAARRWMEAFAIGYADVARCSAGPPAEYEVARALRLYIDSLLSACAPNLVTEILTTYQVEMSGGR